MNDDADRSGNDGLSDAFEFAVDGVALTVVSCVGLVGTVMSIRVLLTPSLRNSFSTLLVGLAVCDAAFLAFAILIIGLPKTWHWYQISVSLHLIPVCIGLISIARTGSVYLTMAVTLERYFAIVRPLHHFGVKKFLLPCSFVFAIAYNIPRFFELEKAVFRFTNETVVEATWLRKNQIYISVYMVWSKIVFLEAVPYVTIIALNALIIRQILRSRRFRKSFHGLSVPTVAVTEDQPQLHPARPSEYEMYAAPVTVEAQIASGCEAVGNSDHNAAVHRESNAAALLLPPMCGRAPPHCLVSPCSTSAEDDDDQLHHRTKAPTRSTSLEISVPGSSAGGPQQPLSYVGGSNQQQEISLGITLISISVLFILCQSVKIIPDLYELICQKDERIRTECISTPFIDTLVSISNLLSCFNSAANFLIYMLRGRKFREAFLSTYGCCAARRASADAALAASERGLSLRRHVRSSSFGATSFNSTNN